MEIYHTETQQAYNALMVELEEKGRKWLGGAKPTQLDKFKNYGKDTYIFDESGVLSFSSGYYFIAHCSNDTLIEYKAKGENKMANKECNKCHKKWHQDSAKYCSWCGKKLVDEPEFRVGDIVASKIFADGSFGLVRLNEDLTNRFTSVYGFWYIKRDCAVRDESLVVFKEDARLATPEEIAEYKAALNFHEHGREPFEVRIGDLVQNANGHKHIIAMAFNNKDLFLLNNTKLLATAEEIDEWLGADDDK